MSQVKTLQIRVDGYACIGINQQDARLNFCWHIVTENVRPYFSKPLFCINFANASTNTSTSRKSCFSGSFQDRLRKLLFADLSRSLKEIWAHFRFHAGDRRVSNILHTRQITKTVLTKLHVFGIVPTSTHGCPSRCFAPETESSIRSPAYPSLQPAQKWRSQAIRFQAGPWLVPVVQPDAPAFPCP